MKDLIILGNGPHAQEMADIVAQINISQPTWSLLGCLVTAAQVDLVGKTVDNLVVLGTIIEIGAFPQACLAATHPTARANS